MVPPVAAVKLEPSPIVVVTGGRDFEGSAGDERRLVELLDEFRPRIVRHGGCRGADTWSGYIAHNLGMHVEVWPATQADAQRWASRMDYARIVYPPSWARWPSAGPKRNVAMLLGNGHPAGQVIACPGGTGTMRCIEAATTIAPVTFLHDADSVAAR